MKVAISGGHLSPAIAVINCLKKRKDTEIIFFGRKYSFDKGSGHSLEYTSIKKLNIPFRNLQSGKVKRHLTKDAIQSLFQIPKGFIIAYNQIKREKPDVFLGFGGFLSLPLALSCFLTGIPVVIHEQTQQAGLANKIISRFATKICTSFPESQKFFPKKRTVLTGNPMRKEIFKVIKQLNVQKGKKIIYVTGGSTGSHAINMLIKNSLKELLKLGVVIHQTGDNSITNDHKNLQEIRISLSNSEKENYVLKKYISPEEIGWIYKNSDVIVSRSGINTVLELIATKKTALLLPLQTGQKNEQLKNAIFYTSTGLGEYANQNISPEEFITKIKSLIDSAQKRKKFAKIVTGANDAAEKITNILFQLSNEKSKKKS